MDTELLRTFLEVRKTRHFAKAAENLFLTQAAVSARVKQLETLIGQRLFTRGRNNIQLTPAGFQLVPYAEAILRTWSQALMDAAVSDTNSPLFVVGCVPTLREIYLDEWLPALRSATPNRLLQIQSLNTQQLLSRLRERAIGLGIMYEPPRASDIWAKPLMTFDLLLVSASRDCSLDTPLPGYVYVDWGETFSISHTTKLAGRVAPQLSIDSPASARKLLLNHGGAAYLASPMLEQDLAGGRLHRVADAPVFERTVYLIGSDDMQDDPSVSEMRRLLQKLSAR